jgi:hypothetical protein
VDDRQGLSQLERLIPLSQWNRHGLFTERKLHNPISTSGHITAHRPNNTTCKFARYLALFCTIFDIPACHALAL